MIPIREAAVMRAVMMREFGPPQVLQLAETAAAQAGPGQVVVDVEIASVTFVETQVRAGRPPNPAMLPALPAILGNGVGGTVAEVGAGVDRALTGRRVVTSLSGTGGYAERAVAAAGQLVEVPHGLALRDVVALASEDRKLQLARDLGADIAISYGDHDWPRRVRGAVGGGVDVVFDGVGSDTARAAFGLLRSE